MKLVICRVNYAELSVDGQKVASIEKGLFCLAGFGKEDTEKDAEFLAKKCAAMRIFADENGKMNLGVKDIGGKVLVEPNFTLYADISHGNRPSFFDAREPSEASRLFDFFCDKLVENGVDTERGIFGADMQTELSMDGPVTIIASSQELLGGKI